MKIVVAPNAFKESLTADGAARAISRGFRKALPAAEIVRLPVADGGDGTGDVLKQALGGRSSRHRITGPLGRPVQGELIEIRKGPERSAVIEMACVSGLRLVPPPDRNPMETTTRGLGEMIAIARRRRARRIMIGLGGSATVDGGTGMAAALGFRLLDKRGKPIPMGGRGLERLARISPPPDWEPSAADPPRIVAMHDVANRLLGPKGAAPVFGPQKGATPAMVRRLEAGLANLAERIEHDLGRKVRRLTGGGAAGGLGAGLAGFLGAELRPGAEVVLDAIGFGEALRGARWVVTGEGRLDLQTLAEKAPAVVARWAAEADVPTIALAGQVAPELLAAFARPGTNPFAACFSIEDGPMALEEAMTNAAKLLEQTAIQVGKLLASMANRMGKR